MELKDIQDHRLQRVLKHDGTRQLFIGECGQDPKLDHQQIFINIKYIMGYHSYQLTSR